MTVFEYGTSSGFKNSDGELQRQIRYIFLKMFATQKFITGISYVYCIFDMDNRYNTLTSHKGIHD